MKIQQINIILAIVVLAGVGILTSQANANDFGEVFHNQTPPGLAEHSVEDEVQNTPELMAQQNEASEDGDINLSGEALNDIMPAAGSDENEGAETATETEKDQKTEAE